MKATKGKTKQILSNWWIMGAIFLASTIIIGIIAYLLGGNMQDWNGLKKAPGTPPDIVFMIVWPIFYISLGVCILFSYMNKDISEKQRKIDILWFYVHMATNMFWSMLFFRLNMQLVSLLLFILIIPTAIYVMYRMWRNNIVSGVIFTIYTTWLMFAFYLNLAIVLINHITL